MKETTIFREALGDSPVIRVLDFLIEGRGLDYSLSDIAENSNIGWTTLHRIWNKLEKFEMVIFTREIGRAKLHKLNIQDPTVQKMVKLHWEIMKAETDKMLESKQLLTMH